MSMEYENDSSSSNIPETSAAGMYGASTSTVDTPDPTNSCDDSETFYFESDHIALKGL